MYALFPVYPLQCGKCGGGDFSVGGARVCFRIPENPCSPRPAVAGRANPLPPVADFGMKELLFVGVLIAPANAQNEKNMYSYKKIGNKYIVSINNHTEIVKALNAFCKEKGILSGSINGIGAIGELTLRFFDPKTKAYDDKTFREQMEISNLTGNISSMNEQVYLHLHITVGRSDYSALAGHLLSAIQNGAGEFVVEDYSERISRTYNPDLGLNIYDFER